MQIVGIIGRMSTLAKPLLDVREAADVLSVSPRTVYGLIERGDLPAYRVGGQLRLSLVVLEDWLRQHSTTETGP